MKEKEVTERGNYFLRLERGEDILPAIADFCARKGIGSAAFTGIGAVEGAKIGFYDLHARAYGSTEYPAIMELVSLTGNVAQGDGKPYVHAHAAVSDEKNAAFGGHLFSASVGVTVEVHLRAFDERITRTLNDEVGLKLLDLQ